MNEIILQKWYVLDEPWGDGTGILAGSKDPHLGTVVCDNAHALFNPDAYNTEQCFREVMSHIVRLHNRWLEDYSHRKEKY